MPTDQKTMPWGPLPPHIGANLGQKPPPRARRTPRPGAGIIADLVPRTSSIPQS